MHQHLARSIRNLMININTSDCNLSSPYELSQRDLAGAFCIPPPPQKKKKNQIKSYAPFNIRALPDEVLNVLTGRT